MAIAKKPKAGTKTVAGRQVTAPNAAVKRRTAAQRRADAGAAPKNRMTAAEKAKAKKQKELRDAKTPQSVKDARAARQEALRQKREGKTGGKTGGKTDPKPKVGGGKSGDKKPTKLQVWRQKRRDLSAARKAALAPLVATVKKTRAQAAKIREKFKTRFEAHDKKKPAASVGGGKPTTGGKKPAGGSGKKPGQLGGSGKKPTGGKKPTTGTARKPRQGR